MALRYLLYVVVLLLAFGLSFSMGEREERYTTLAAALASILSPLVQSSGFEELQIGILMTDTAFLAFMITIMLASRKIWPIIASGILLSTLAIHLAPAVTRIDPRVYGGMSVFLSYLFFVPVLVGCLVECRIHDNAPSASSHRYQQWWERLRRRF